jgi:hypothetical protein
MVNEACGQGSLGLGRRPFPKSAGIGGVRRRRALLTGRPWTGVVRTGMSDTDLGRLSCTGSSRHLSTSGPPAPDCSTCPASVPSAPPGCWSRSATSPGSPTAITSRPGPVPHPSTLLRRPHAPPAVPRRQPSDQPGPAHHGHRPAPQPRHRRNYYDRKKGPRKSSMEAMRCLKRHLSDIVYRQLLNDAVHPRRDGHGRATGIRL